MGFVQVWLDVAAINISNISALVRAGKASLSITSYYLSLSKAKQRLRADGILMPHLLQSPTVVCNAIFKFNAGRQNIITSIRIDLNQ